MINHKFLVVVPVYNCEPYIEKCLLSILNQTYRNFHLIVVDDCSTDETPQIIKSIWDKHNQSFQIHTNEKRIHSPVGNFVKGIELCPGGKDDIIVTVDGDDWLYSDHVLQIVNGYYRSSQTWLTYGSFTSVSGTMENYSKPIECRVASYRMKGGWVTSHLRTLRRGLWDKINKEDLKDLTTGEYYVHYGDASYMYPAIEMAGRSHIRFVSEILYVYNDRGYLCQVNDFKKGEDWNYIKKQIKRRKQYSPLTSL
jgi:glycosyltransferase involved in cell wall biosynthesis